ncbi:MAG: O-antigen ligase family protein [Armatimonadota bacterium]
MARTSASRAERAAPGVEEPGLSTLVCELPFLLALFLAPLAAGHLIAGPTRPTVALVLSGLVWISLLLRLVVPGRVPLGRPAAWPLLLLFPALSAASFFVSAQKGATVAQTLLYTTFAAGAWLAADIVRRGGAMRLLGAILAGALVVAGLGLQEWGYRVRIGDTGWRAFSTFTNQNFFAGYLVMGLLLTLSLASWRPEEFKPGMWLLALGLLTLALGGALMITGSRGGILSLGGGILVLFLAAGTRGQLRGAETWKRLGVLLALLAVSAFAFSGVLRGRLAAAAPASPLPAELCPPGEARSANADSNEFRKLTWQGTLAMAQARPLLGWGAGTYETAFPPHAVAIPTRHAHQSYLQLFAETGAPSVLLWAALLLWAIWRLWRAPRAAEWGWTAGAAAALAASAAHNLLDSLWFVPALGLLAWTVVGMALGLPAAKPVESSQPAPGAAAGRSPWHWAGLALAGAGLVACGIQALGWRLYEQGDAEKAVNPTAALETLRTAEALLPWSYQVAEAQRLAHLYQGEWAKAIEASRRSISLAESRPFAYLAQARIWENRMDGEQSPTAAVAIIDAGLRHTPNDLALLFARAEIWDRLGEPGDALASYRRIVELEDTPVGRVRPLAEVVDYRFPLARLRVASTAPPEEALTHYRRAACVLAQRRRLHDANPALYQSGGAGEYDPELERRLRQEETRAWRQVAQRLRRQGDERVAALAEEQAGQVEATRERLEELLQQYEAARGLPE